MNIERKQDGSYVIHATAEDYAIICAAFNNIEEKVEPREYTTLMGASGEAIEAVRSALFAARKA